MSNYFKHQLRSKKPMEIVGWILLGIIGFTALVVLFGFVIMWLWNWLMPELFDLPKVTYWQGMGLFLLAKIFFGGFSGGDKSGKKKNRNFDKECRDDKSRKNSLSKWEFYDKFWNEEGSEAFENYVKNKNNKSGEEE